MLHGRFGSFTGRPYIKGRLALPRMQIAGDVLFLVDTGADKSLLMPIDGYRLELDYGSLSGGIASLGIGGVSHNFVESAVVVFAETGRNLYLYETELGIATPNPEIMGIPSILGRDILDQWRMTYNPSRNYLGFRVVTADRTIPID